jgi:hypothetical protein
LIFGVGVCGYSCVQLISPNKTNRMSRVLFMTDNGSRFSCTRREVEGVGCKRLLACFCLSSTYDAKNTYVAWLVCGYYPLSNSIKDKFELWSIAPGIAAGCSLWFCHRIE